MASTLPEPQALPPQPFVSPSFSDRLTHWLNRLQPSPEAWVLVSALLIGGGTGLAIALFRGLIRLFQNLSFETLMGYLSVWGNWTLIFVPALGGLIIGLMRRRFSDYLGQGLSTFINSPGKRISPRRLVVKMLAAAISLGTGASLGPEGPSVEIGSNVGILLGQTFQVSKDRYRLLLGAGAAAGLAAGFNAPIAGVFFALEVVLGSAFSTPTASLILLSAVVASLISSTILGEHPAFNLPAYQVLNPWEWVYYFGLGLLASLVSIAFTQTLKFTQACFRGEIAWFSWLSNLPAIARPILGGVCVGVMALWLPQILDVGYGSLSVILSGDPMSLKMLLLLLLVKLVATAISSGSGLVGGIFAPAMFLGACLGTLYGSALAIVLPPELANIAPPPAYAMVGMAAVLAGSVRAPLTAILLLFELTKNYLIILPLMAAVGVSVWVVELIKAQRSVQGLELPQMGVDLKKDDDRVVLDQLTVGAVSQPSYLALPATTALLEAGLTMVQRRCRTALVVDERALLIGIVTLTDIKRHILQPLDPAQPITLQDICTTEVLYAHRDEPVSQAIERMDTRGLHLLPVVADENPRQVLGVIERDHILLASELESTQKALQGCMVS